MSDREREDLIAGYIRGCTEPVQWVGWWLQAAETAAGHELGSVLFEPGGGVLRDLTSPAIRSEVIRVVLGSEPLHQSVGAEAERFLESSAERLAAEQPPDT